MRPSDTATIEMTCILSCLSGLWQAPVRVSIPKLATLRRTQQITSKGRHFIRCRLALVDNEAPRALPSQTERTILQCGHDNVTDLQFKKIE
jgi:hypothetical protein